jgi:archaemetzincin
MQILLQPVATKINYNTLNSLGNDISKEFENIQVVISPSIEPYIKTIFQFSLDRSRNQLNSTKLLQWFLDNVRIETNSKILIIVDADAYSSGLNFVFGEAFSNGIIAAIYLPRLKQEFYGLEPNEQLFYERMVKECVHELGHTCGLTHCKKARCVMHFSNSLHDTDIKGRSFCDTCNSQQIASVKLID